MLDGGFLPHTPSAERSPRAAKDGEEGCFLIFPLLPRHSPPRTLEGRGGGGGGDIEKNLQEEERNVVLFFVRCKRGQIEQTRRRYVMSVAIV